MINRTLNFAAEIVREHKKPVWESKHKIDYETDSFKLLDFSISHKGTPTVILPPQAGGHSNIADYNPPKASLIQTCLKNGREHLYCVEYKPASKNNNQTKIDDLTFDNLQIVSELGKRINIIGLCQGVWNSAIFSARYPHMVKELILAAGPIDFHADPNNAIYKAMKLIPDIHTYCHPIFVANGGCWPGTAQSIGFKLTDPYEKIFKAYNNLFWNCTDPIYMDRHKRFVDWFEYRQDMGKWCLDAAERLFRDNLLVKGKLKIHGKFINLENITAKVKILWSKKDDITSPEQIRAIMKFVDTQEFIIENCGHIGNFNSSRSLDHYWPRMLNED